MIIVFISIKPSTLMKVKNLFMADLEADSDAVDIEQWVEKRYGIPRDLQVITRHGTDLFLSLRADGHVQTKIGGSSAPIRLARRELNEIFGSSREVAACAEQQQHAIKCSDMARLLSIDNYDLYLNRITSEDQKLILSNIEECMRHLIQRE